MSEVGSNHPLFHLSADEIQQVVDLYRDGEKVSILLADFKILCAPGRLRNFLSPRPVSRPCTICGGRLVEEITRRTGRGVPLDKVWCEECRHRETGMCTCDHCLTLQIKRKADEDAARRGQVKEAIAGLQSQSVSLLTSSEFAGLTVAQAVSFLAFTCCSPRGHDAEHPPLRDSAVPFAPTEAWGRALLSDLQASGLIALSERSDPEAIAVSGEGIVTYSYSGVRWRTLIDSPATLLDKIEHAGFSGEWPASWLREINDLRFMLARAECREFLDYCARTRGMRVRAEFAIESLFTNILRDHSVAQCYRIIWQGARSAADFMVRERAGPVHAANYMVGACQRWADRARVEGWQVFPFRRNFECPRSMVSHVLYDVILRTGERGFDEVIRDC